MNHRETIAYYEKLKEQQAEAPLYYFLNCITDGVIPFIIDGRITEELGQEIIKSIIRTFQVTPNPTTKKPLRL